MTDSPSHRPSKAIEQLDTSLRTGFLLSRHLLTVHGCWFDIVLIFANLVLWERFATIAAIASFRFSAVFILNFNVQIEQLRFFALSLGLVLSFPLGPSFLLLGQGFMPLTVHGRPEVIQWTPFQCFHESFKVKGHMERIRVERKPKSRKDRPFAVKERFQGERPVLREKE